MRTLSTEQMYQIIVDKTDQLPSLPSIVYELLALVNDSMASLKAYEDLISRDPSLASQVLKMANSAFYGVPGETDSIQKAITYLGTEKIYQIAITATVFENLEADDSRFFRIREFWQHSFVTALCSEQLALELNFENRSSAFLSGLLHDVGKIVFQIFNSESWNQICAYAQQQETSVFDAENNLNALKHTEIGYRVCQKWNFPKEVLLAIRHHHDYDKDFSSHYSADQVKLIDIVSLANILSHTLNIGHSGYNIRTEVPLEIVERQNISRKRWVDFLMRLRDQLEASESVMASLLEN